MEALVANLGDACAACYMVVALDLCKEFCFNFDYDNGQTFPVDTLADGGDIVCLCRVVKLEIYGIVDMSELVNVVETYLEW